MLAVDFYFYYYYYYYFVVFLVFSRCSETRTVASEDSFSLVFLGIQNNNYL